MNKNYKRICLAVAFCALWICLLSLDYKSVNSKQLDNVERLEYVSADIVPASTLQAIDDHFATCREEVAVLANNNVKVLEKYDSFTKSLRNVFIEGRGLIEKDLHFIIDGIQFAAEQHKDHLRKNPDNIPFIIHPIGVAEYVVEIGKVYDPDIIVAALLHDAIEDAKTPYDLIVSKCGSRVANYVQEITGDRSLTSKERKRLQVEMASKRSAAAAEIIMAEKLYNLKDLLQNPPLNWSDERIDAYFRWAKNEIDELPWVNKRLKGSVDEVIASYWASINH